MRPRNIAEFVGQSHLLEVGKPLRQAITNGHIHSMIFWGPPGTGKTTLARLVAAAVDGHFLNISAVLSGVKEIRAAIESAKLQQQQFGKPTVLFVDEVHRFNKAQQDAFLPHIESGTIHFIGATTENPAFELNNALLSRARVYVLRALREQDLVTLIERSLQDPERGLAEYQLQLSQSAKLHLAALADGDARRALNLLETVSDLAVPGDDGKRQILEGMLDEVAGQSQRRFDKGGDQFYDLISALHKSVRGSDPDAALYWLSRMLDAGCDPLYLARRLVRIASEDIGNADPRALPLALTAWEVQERLGSPEGELALAQAVTYLSIAAKSNAVYRAYNDAMRDVREHGSLEVPIHLRNAPTKLARELGHGEQYRYAHDFPDGYVPGEQYLPEKLVSRRYYQPSSRGLEKKIAERLEYLAELDRQYEKE